jgi:rhomboid protease GluP
LTQRKAPLPASPSPSTTQDSRNSGGTVSRLRRFPVTFGLIGMTSIVYLTQLLTAALLGDGQTCGQGDLICGLGSKMYWAIAAGQIWRLITPIFIHVGTIHILVNMFSLYNLGPVVEHFFSSPRMLANYLLSGMAGTTMSLGFSRSISAGASGAIFGLLGALGVFLYLHRRIFGRFGQLQLRQILFIALLNLGLGFLPGIDNWGHLGGLLAGAGLAWFLGPRFKVVLSDSDKPQLVDQQPWRDIRWKTALAAAAIAALAAMAIFSPFPTR